MTTTETCPYVPGDLPRLLALEPELVARPWPLYEVLRSDAPVVKDDKLGAYVVSRHDDIVEVLRDTDTFSNSAASGPSSVTGLAKKLIADPATPDALRRQAERRLTLADSPVLLFTDPPLHKRQRALVSGAFHPRRVKQLEPEIRRLAEELVASLPEDGRLDAVSGFSVQVPMTIIAALLGVPPSNMQAFKRWSNAFTSGVGALDQSPEAIARVFADVDEFYDYFTVEIDQRRTAPQDDLLSDLVAARLDGEEPLTLAEMLQMLVQFLVAGNETTANAMSNVLLRLATDKPLQEQVRTDLSLVKALVEEMLRLEAPVQGTFRMAMKDTVVGGVDVPAGSLLWMLYQSGNRDGATFEAPESLDLSGERPPHLSFARGEHFCLGANIAKLELQVSVEVLLTKLSDLSLDCRPTDIPYHRSFVLRGVSSLPMRWTRVVGGIDS